MFLIIMASHFKWYPAESEVVVPFNARYAFPSQANKAMKMTPRIPPKNASEFSPGNVIRLEFPAQGYVNPGKTTLEFDVVLQYDPQDSEYSYVRFQNNIQSLFSRVRLLYGATPIEDIPSYNVIVRKLTEWTSSTGLDQTSIAEGIGGTTHGGFFNGEVVAAPTTTAFSTVCQNVRQNMIHGIDMTTTNTFSAATPSVVSARSASSGAGKIPNAAYGSNVGGALVSGMTNVSGVIHPWVKRGFPVRRYQVQLMLGVFNQEKLIPTKFMASQLSIEITLESPDACLYYRPSQTFTTQPGTATGIGTPSSTKPTYLVRNVNLIPEILEFDASYDETFLRGLQSGGVPIKFSTWNNFKFSGNQSASLNLQIQERSRSVKAIFAMMRRDPVNIETDSGASFFNTNETADGNSTFQEYQFRIGGRYFPSQPVQCSTEVGGKIPNGGCEAYVELAKALNTLGDYRLSTPLHTLCWAYNPGATDYTDGTVHDIHPEFDYDHNHQGYKWTGSPIISYKKRPGIAAGSTTSSFAAAESGHLPSCQFAMAIDLETSNGLEISGLNAEEQSDISLIARYSGAQAEGFVYDVFTYIDAMIVLRENNVLELIM